MIREARRDSPLHTGGALSLNNRAYPVFRGYMIFTYFENMGGQVQKIVGRGENFKVS